MKSRKAFISSLAICLLSVLALIRSSGETSVAASGDVKKIIIFYSYPPGEWSHGINDSLESVLKDKMVKYALSSAIFHAEYWRNQPKEKRQNEKDRLLGEIAKVKPDLILLCDDEVSDFLASDIRPMGIPVIFTGLNREKSDIPWLQTFAKNKIAGTLELYRTEDTMKLLKGVRPGAKRISILTSANDTSELVSKQIGDDLRRMEAQGNVKLRATYKLRFWSEWKTAIEEINKLDDAAWVLVPYDVRDENNQEVSVERVGSWLKANLKVPSLGIISVSTRIGILAGIPISPESLGRQMGEQVAEFFSGKKLSDIGIVRAKYFKEELNLNQLSRLKLRLPPEMARNQALLVREKKLKYGR